VQNIELDRGHPINVSLNRIERHEIPGDVDHQPAPLKTGSIVDANIRQDPPIRPRCDKLQQGFGSLICCGKQAGPDAVADLSIAGRSTIRRPSID
jgi:hypothetical protein